MLEYNDLMEFKCSICGKINDIRDAEFIKYYYKPICKACKNELTKQKTRSKEHVWINSKENK